MKSWLFYGRSFCLAMSIIFICAFQGCSVEKEAELPRIDSSALKETILAEHIEQPMVQGKNVIYCASFQLAWNQLRDDIVKEAIALENEPDLVPFLNDSPLNFEAIGEDPNFLAMAGYGYDGIVERINQELAKIGDHRLALDMVPDDILAYAYMEKLLSFRLPFEKLEKWPIQLHGQTQVKGFGVDIYDFDEERRNMVKQVWLLHLRTEEHPDSQLPEPSIEDSASSQEFAIRIETKSSTDELILAMIEPRGTLLDTIQSVEERHKTDKDTPLSLEEGTSFAVPDIAFNIRHEFPSLTDKLLINEVVRGYRVKKCLQDTRFRLNRKGVKLKSEALILATLSERSTEPVSYRFDKPFLLYMKKKSAEYPYFAVWIANTELLIKEEG